MDFTIITPSFGQLDHLACCIASVADQEGVEVEHIVQDGGTMGFREFSSQMAKQWPDRQKRDHADCLIDTSQGLEFAEQQVKQVIDTYRHATGTVAQALLSGKDPTPHA
jgi:dephospho-CoA kinase